MITSVTEISRMEEIPATAPGKVMGIATGTTTETAAGVVTWIVALAAIVTMVVPAPGGAAMQTTVLIE